MYCILFSENIYSEIVCAITPNKIETVRNVRMILFVFIMTALHGNRFFSKRMCNNIRTNKYRVYPEQTRSCNIYVKRCLDIVRLTISVKRVFAVFNCTGFVRIRSSERLWRRR